MSKARHKSRSAASSKEHGAASSASGQHVVISIGVLCLASAIGYGLVRAAVAVPAARADLARRELPLLVTQLNTAEQ